MKRIFMILCSLISLVKAQETINLYADSIPNSTDKGQVNLEKNVPGERKIIVTPLPKP